MSKSTLSAAHFNDEAAAYAFVEAHLWPDGRVCPHCGVVDRSAPLKGKTSRIGLYKCYACRKPFSVKVGTIFEDSHIAMRDWLVAIHLICSSKKGISANQLHRTLGITLKSAWFMAHRIREALKPSGPLGKMGGNGEEIEIDETFIGQKPDVAPKAGGAAHKHAVVALVERRGAVRSFHVEDVRSPSLYRVIEANISRKANIKTDERASYKSIGWNFASHEVVSHSEGEYVRGTASTNTVEGVFSIFKRGMVGTYQHCGEQHLQRYLSEFDFRYSNRKALGVDDEGRSVKALKGAAGKRLTYRTTSGQEARA